MHKKLEAELVSLAHNILQMKNKSDAIALREKARLLYERLSVLTFVDEYLKTTPNAVETKEKIIAKIEAIEKVELIGGKDEVEELIEQLVEDKIENPVKVEIKEEKEIWKRKMEERQRESDARTKEHEKEMREFNAPKKKYGKRSAKSTVYNAAGEKREFDPSAR